ncbi:MAG: hypothetical protein AAFX56_04025 [Pseudomonadota bacterium]
MRYAKLSLLGTALLLAAGCGEGARIELSVASDDPQTVQRTQAILYYRLNEATRNPFSNLATGYFPETGKLVFEYDRSAPDPDSLRFLYETTGHFRLAVAGGEGEEAEWVANDDIETADASRSGDAGQVFLALNPKSAERLQTLSTANIGVRLVSSIDGRAFQEATVQAPFGRYLKIDVDSETQARNLAIVLRSGALPTQVVQYASD